MKKIITSLLLCLAAGSLYAQSPEGDYVNEIGIKGGGSFFTTPHNTQYTGTSNKFAGTYGLTYHRNITDEWQVGLEAAATKWKSTGTQDIHGLYGSDFGLQPTNYVYAKGAYTIMASLNHVMPFYTEFKLLRSSFYYGVSGGMVFTNNDGVSTYSLSNGSGSNQSQYLSEYHYDQGHGFVVGVQVGYTYYVSYHFGFNVEADPRFTKVYTDNSTLNDANNRYSLFYFPFTAGLRFRF